MTTSNAKMMAVTVKTTSKAIFDLTDFLKSPKRAWPRVESGGNQLQIGPKKNLRRFYYSA